MTTPAFSYTSGNPDNLVGGQPAVMTDVQGPFYDLRAYLNTNIVSVLNSLSPPSSVVANAPVLDVGTLNQIRAGHQLSLADFTNLGLSVPVGLFNLTDLTNLGTYGPLLNKGAVPFGTGINGVAGTSAVFSGSTGQALYIPDAGGARLRTGSFGCWARTAKRGTVQYLVSKLNAAATDRGFALLIDGTTNACQAVIATAPTAWAATAAGVSDVADDRWHHLAAAYDGTVLRLYVDGVLEATAAAPGVINGSVGPFNIGGYGADGGVSVPVPGAHYGRVDEAFVTGDVLTEDQIRILYAARIVHTLGGVPRSATLNVRRQRKGAALAVTDFTTQPLRLHNFTAGALTDQGSNGQALTPGGTPVAVAGADGTPNSAYSFSSPANFSATDAGLPAALTARSYGCWLKTMTATGTLGAMAWSTTNQLLYTNGGLIVTQSGGDVISGPFMADGQWHFAVVVEDSAGLPQRKLYLDGRLVGSSTALGSITLGGANKFRVGALQDGNSPFTGQIDGAFVTGYAIAQDEITRLYAKGSMSLGVSPKEVGAHVERMDATDIYFVGDSLDSQWTVDVGLGRMRTNEQFTIWGRVVAAAGTRSSGIGDWTPTRTAVGTYDIRVPSGQTIDGISFSSVTSAAGYAIPHPTTRDEGGRRVGVLFTNIGTGAALDTDWEFSANIRRRT